MGFRAPTINVVQDIASIVSLAITPDGKTVYADTLGNNGLYPNVSVIDTQTASLITQVLGMGPVNTIALTPDGSELYCVDTLNQNVYIVDTTNYGLTTLNGFISPSAVVFGVTTGYAYAYVLNSNGTVSVIDMATHSVVGEITYANGSPTATSGIFSVPSGQFVYISNGETGVVAIVNTATNQITGTISTGFSAGFYAIQVIAMPNSESVYIQYNDNGTSGIGQFDVGSSTLIDMVTLSGYSDLVPFGITPDGSYLYALYQNSNFFSLFAIDTSNNTVVNGEYEVTGAVVSVQFTPDSAYVYCNYEVSDGGGEVSPYTLVIGVPFTVGATLTNGLVSAFTPDSSNSFTTLWNGFEVGYNGVCYRCEVPSGTVITEVTQTFATDSGVSGYMPYPVQMIVSEDGGRIFALLASLSGSGAGGAVVVIDINTTSYAGAIGSFQNPKGIAVNPSGSQVWTVSPDGGNAIVVDTSTNEIIATVVSVGAAAYIAFTPSGGYAWISGSSVSTGTTDSVVVVDTSTYEVVTTFSGFDAPPQIVFTPDGAFAYMFDNSAIYVYNAVEIALVDTIAATGVTAIAMTPDGKYVWVGPVGIQIIDTATNQFTSSLPFDAVGIAFTPDGLQAYVALGNAFEAGVIDVASGTELGTFSSPDYEFESYTGVVIAAAGNYGALQIGSDVQNVYVGIFVPLASVAAFIRQTPRDDNLGLGPPRQRIGRAQPSSVTNSYRQGFRGTYV